MDNKEIQPSVNKTAFICPHCNACTTQAWYSLHREFITDEKERIPRIPTPSFIENLKDKVEINDNVKNILIEFYEKTKTGLVFFEKSKNILYDTTKVHNLHLSECYNCKKVSVWVHDRLVFPLKREGPNPNPDLPEDIVAIFEEARTILNPSPRGAAALLRLCIQMLCKHLGEKGDNINDDIASLVKKGLKPLDQKSLDIVRVIGNEVVHPGEINLNDDLDTATMLFDLVNSIADQMISHPRRVEETYKKLPESKRKAIKKRDIKAKS